MTDGASDVLVVGYGSDLHCDDAVGRRVAEQIERFAFAGVTVRSVTQLLPELVEPISRSSLVVFVDASVEVDDVVVRPITWSDRRPGFHDLSPSGLLGLVADLGTPAPPAVLVAVPVVDLSIGDSLSEPGTHAAERAVATVIDVVTTVTGPPGADVVGSDASEPCR